MFDNIHSFNSLLDRIDDCITIFEQKNMEDVRYKMYLSNGKEIEISYNIDNLPHLLGVNTTFLRSTGIYDGSSYNILVDILNNPNKLFNQIKNGHIKPENVFSDHIEEKLNNFRNICDMNIRKIEFIAKYDKTRHFTDKNDQLDGDYYIGFRSDSKTLSILGLKESNGLYYPLTNLYFHYYRDEKEEFLKRLLNNQNLLVLQTLRKNRYVNGNIDRNKIFYSIEDKEEKLQLLEKYAEEYNATCDTHKDYLFYINKTINLYDEKNKLWDILSEITESIQKKEIIDIPSLEEKYGELKSSLVRTISAHNDSLMNGDENSKEYSYQDTIEEWKKAKKEVERLTNLTEKLDEQNKKLIEENSTLKSENVSLKDDKEKIRAIVNR